MGQTIQCVQCGVALNLPDQAVGRRLKCPKCGAKFTAGAPAGQPQQASPPDRPDTTFELTRKPSGVDLPVMPLAEGDLRETFDLESLTGSAPSKPAANKDKREAGDALALFEDRPKGPRRKTGAEGRAQARRCPTCGSVVPQGMSLCSRCGLDLDTGQHIGLDDDDLIPNAPSRQESTPLVVAIIGGICAALAFALGGVAVVLAAQGMNGVIYFLPVAAFGVYAAVQFLRMKSVKLLLAALTIGAVINILGMMVLPIYNAMSDIKVEQRTVASDDPDADNEIIKPVTELLDTQRITSGAVILFLYAILCIFLLSPTIQKHYRR